MKKFIKFIAAVFSVFALGYAAGGWWARSKANERWTDGAVRAFYKKNHEITRHPKKMVTFVCGKDTYGYEVELNKVVSLDSDPSQRSLLPKVTPERALTVTGFLGVTNISNYHEATKNLNDVVIAILAVTGVALGYKHWDEEVPRCDRDTVQAVKGDISFWQNIYDSEQSATPLRLLLPPLNLPHQ